MSSSTQQSSPYLSARHEWDERYGDLLTRARNWRTVAILTSLAALVSGAGSIVANARAAHVAPFVAVIDGQGRPLASGYADGSSIGDDRLKRASLFGWVGNLRLVTTDSIAQRKAIDAVYAQIGNGTAAQTFISEFYRNDPPFHRAQTETVSVDVSAVLPTSARTYEVDWTETTRDLYGAIKATEHWKGSFQIATNPPSDERLARVNPLGLYVTDASWSKVL